MIVKMMIMMMKVKIMKNQIMNKMFLISKMHLDYNFLTINLEI